MASLLPWIAISAPAWSMAAVQLPPVPKTGSVVREAKPQLYVAQRHLELGTVLEGDKPTVSWSLENRGNADLVIDHARTSCGCTIVELTEKQKVIAPGESLTLKAFFDTSGRFGAQNKAVSVYSNDPAEPVLKLFFTANVDSLYAINPPSPVILRTIRRGETASRSLELLPRPGRNLLEVRSIEVPNGSSLSFSHEPFEAQGRTGERVRITVSPDAALGTVKVKAKLKLRVDGIDRERVITIRGEVVGDLTWHPKVVDNTRHESGPGQRFAPVMIRSTDKTPFDILTAEAGSLFDVTYEPIKQGPKRTRYRVFLTLRHDAPPGPFGTTLAVRTTSLDQPVIRVPVFGVVAPPIKVDPPIIVLRDDETPVGRRRRVKLQVLPQQNLEVSEISCDFDAVTAEIDREASARYRHICFLDVQLGGRLPEGSHHAMLTLVTNVPGARRIEVPVTIDVPRHTTSRTETRP